MIVASDMQQYLPIFHPVQIIAPINSAFAHGLLVQIMGV
jgi:hypothetical protein